jgi:hypothetical protein
LGKGLTGRTWTLFFFVVFYAIFANLPFWTASPLLGLVRNGLFCVEFAAVGILALFVPGLYSGIILFVVIAADLVCGVSQTFYLSPAECVRSSSFLLLLSGKRIFLVFAVTLLALLMAMIAARFPVANIRKGDRWIAAGALMVLALASVSADFVAVVRETGKMPNPFRLELPADSVKATYFSKVWFSRLPLVRLLRNEVKSVVVNGKVLASKTQPSFVPSAADRGLRSGTISEAKDVQEMPNLVLVLVESWGLTKDDRIRSSLVQPYLTPEVRARYEVNQGAAPFYGGTVSGEARELCDSMIGFHLLDASAQELKDCLPRRLANRGYHTLALHGMDGHMFKRLNWWSTVGFQEQWFRDRFRQEGLPDCAGAFTGTCDSSVAQWIGQRLAKSEPNPDFVYWVTLNSHLPVPIPPPLRSPAACALSPDLVRQPAFCSWYQLVSNVHQSVAQTVLAGLARPTIFVIVGDHAPGFANLDIRSQFSSEVVPYIVLTPRTSAQSPSIARR